MGNAIYRKQGEVSEYQYWTSSFGLSPLKTNEYPFQFIEEYDGDYFLYISMAVFKGDGVIVNTNGSGKKYIADGITWAYVADLIPFTDYDINGDIIYANADVETEPI